MVHCRECGAVLADDFNRSPRETPRSGIHNARHHKVVKCAFDNWPASHPYQPATKEHLRKWLYISVGFHRTLRRNVCITRAGAGELLAVMLQAGVYAQINIHADFYEVLIPKSTKFPENGGDLQHKDAVRLFQDVDDVICAALQIESTDKLLEA